MLIQARKQDFMQVNNYITVLEKKQGHLLEKAKLGGGRRLTRINMVSMVDCN